MQISQLYIYPIKSLGGIAVGSVNVTDRGFEFDRRWMLIDENNRFVSQRENAVMALLQVELVTDGLNVFNKQHPLQSFQIPFPPYHNEQVTVKIWDESTTGVFVSEAADKWFSAQLGIPVRLVYMPEDAHIVVDQQYQVYSLTSFSDGYPILLLSEASLDDLNSRLTEALPIDRFRPNLVISGAQPFEEDNMKEFFINGIHFYGVSRCARCVVTTIDQETALKSKEPLTTLATYRKEGNKIYFGENVIAGNIGAVSIGDKIEMAEQERSL